MHQERLVLVIQKPKGDSDPERARDKGRLSGPTLDRLHRAGLNVHFEGLRMDCVVEDVNGKNYPLTVVQQGNREIGRYMADESGDAAAYGYDRFLDIAPEYRGKVRVSSDRTLNFGACKFQLGVDFEYMYKYLMGPGGNPRPVTLRDAQGQNIATEHPNALQLFADREGISLNIYSYTSGVEGARLRGGKRFAFIADITSSGRTMIDNGYMPVHVIFSSRAIIAYRLGLSGEKREILSDLNERLLKVEETPVAMDAAKLLTPPEFFPRALFSREVQPEDRKRLEEARLSHVIGTPFMQPAPVAVTA